MVEKHQVGAAPSVDKNFVKSLVVMINYGFAVIYVLRGHMMRGALILIGTAKGYMYLC